MDRKRQVAQGTARADLRVVMLRRYPVGRSVQWICSHRFHFHTDTEMRQDADEITRVLARGGHVGMISGSITLKQDREEVTIRTYRLFPENKSAVKPSAGANVDKGLGARSGHGSVLN